MEEKVKIFLDYIDSYRYNMSAVDITGERLADQVYQHLREIAVEKSEIITFGGSLYNAEKYYFKTRDRFYCFSLIWAPTPYYIFEIILEPNYLYFIYEE